MGTDIYSIFQARRPDGHWYALDIDVNDYVGRDFLLFALLGLEHPGVTPIVPLRGLPENDCMLAYPDECEEIYCDGDPMHLFNLGQGFHSWLTSKELLDWYNGPIVTYTYPVAPHREVLLQKQCSYFFSKVKQYVDRFGELRFIYGFTM